MTDRSRSLLLAMAIRFYINQRLLFRRFPYTPGILPVNIKNYIREKEIKMSHFVLAVFTENEHQSVDELMEPFSEHLTVSGMYLFFRGEEACTHSGKDNNGVAKMPKAWNSDDASD